MPAPFKSFASVDRFLTEIASPSTLRPGYVLLGDEAFLYQRCRQGVLAALAPPDTRDFSLHDLDLADTTIFDILDRAQTPSLMAPFQVRSSSAASKRSTAAARRRKNSPQSTPTSAAPIRRR